MPKPPNPSHIDPSKANNSPNAPIKSKKLGKIDVIGLLFLIFGIVFFATSLIASYNQQEENTRKQAEFLAQSQRKADLQRENLENPAPAFDFKQLLGVSQPDQASLGTITLSRFALSQETNNTAPADSITIGGAQQKDIIFLNFFASWCRPCRSEHPLLVKLSDRYDIPMIGVIFQDAPQATAKFLSDMGNPYNFIGQDDKLILAGQLGVQGIPASFIIGENGDILWEHRGEITDNILANLIKIMQNYNIPLRD